MGLGCHEGAAALLHLREVVDFGSLVYDELCPFDREHVAALVVLFRFHLKSKTKQGVARIGWQSYLRRGRKTRWYLRVFFCVYFLLTLQRLEALVCDHGALVFFG